MATDPCRIYGYDYDRLSTMTFTAALEYTTLVEVPAEVSCLSEASARMMYAMEGESIVPEVSDNKSLNINSWRHAYSVEIYL